MWCLVLKITSPIQDCAGYYEGRPCDTPDYFNPKRGTQKANELGTISGKIEFVSESLKKFIPDDKERASNS